MNCVSKLLVLAPVLFLCLIDFLTFEQADRIPYYVVLCSSMLIRSTQWEFCEFDRAVYRVLSARYQTLFAAVIVLLAMLLMFPLAASRYDHRSLFSLLPVVAASLYFVGLLLISTPYSSKGRLFCVVVVYAFTELSDHFNHEFNIVFYMTMLLIAYFLSENEAVYRAVKRIHGWKLILSLLLLVVAAFACIIFFQFSIVFLLIPGIIAYLYPLIFLFHYEKRRPDERYADLQYSTPPRKRPAPGAATPDE